MSVIAKTISSDDPHHLQRQLRQFRMQFEALKQTGMQADPEGVRMLADRLLAFETMATEMGNELKHHRYVYQLADNDQLGADAIIEAAGETNNVIFWPVASRPIGDGA